MRVGRRLAALRGTPGVTRTVRATWESAASGFTQAVPSRDGEPRVVVVEVDTGFLRDLMLQSSDGVRSLYVVERQRALMSVGAYSVNFADARGP